MEEKEEKEERKREEKGWKGTKAGGRRPVTQLDILGYFVP